MTPNQGNKTQIQGNQIVKLEHTQGQSKIFTTIKYSQKNNTTKGDHSPHGSTFPKLLLKIDHPYIHNRNYVQLITKKKEMK